MSAITTVQTDSWQVAAIIAAHNAARDAVVEQRGSMPSSRSQDYTEHFTRIYQALQAAIAGGIPDVLASDTIEPEEDSGIGPRF